MIGWVRQMVDVARQSPSRALYREWSRLQWQSPEELERGQLELVRDLCRHAWATTPYYREVFDDLRITPEDIRSFADFGRLPMLTKAIIRSRLPDLLSSATPAAGRLENHSGGSTGSPLRFFQDGHVFQAMTATMRLSLSFAGWKPSDMMVCIWGNPRDTGASPARVSLRNYLAGSVTLNAYRYGAAELDNWLRIIRKFGSVFVYGYVSALADVAAHVRDTGTRITNVRGVMTSAEKLHAEQREALERAFGCRVFDQYGSREVPGIASECAHGGMHLLIHSAYTEFVPDPESGLNRLVVTCLTNKTMPFLRYDIGDHGAPLAGTCPCGRGFPLMRMDIGRMVDCLVAPGGQRMYGTFFVRQMYGLRGVEGFQFRQREAGRIELFVVRGSGFDAAEAARLEEVAGKLERELPGVAVALQYVADIPRTQGGKHRQVVCEVAS